MALALLVAMVLVTAAWWALALWPVNDAPVWLQRTRYVCFGVGDAGLPDAGGWIGLIGGPAGMFSILLVGFRSSLARLLQRARRSLALASVFFMLGAGTLVMLGAAGTRVWQAQRTSIFDMAGGLPPESYPRIDWAAPALSLLAHDGAPRSLASLRGSPVLVTFAYAHCSTVCPLVVKDVLDAQQTLAAAGTDIAVLVVTLDPWRDTPSRLAQMAQSWALGRDAWMLGGSVADVETVLDAWRVPRERDERTGEVMHPSLVYVVDRDGTVAFAAAGGATALVTLVQRL